MTSKQEFKESQDAGLIVRDDQFAKERATVHCPKRDFKFATTADCFSCSNFIGFMPADRLREIGLENLWVVCRYPIGRSVVYTPSDAEAGK